MKFPFEREDNYRGPEEPVSRLVPSTLRESVAELGFPGLPELAPAVEVDTDAAIQANYFWVHFETERWAPNHQVTLRNRQDGLTRDIFGKYRFGAWHFRFTKSAYPEGLKYKLYLNGESERGEERTQSVEENRHIGEELVDFGEARPDSRFRHGLDDFVFSASPREEEIVPPNTNETVDYDAIVIGSGMSGGILADKLSNSSRKVLILEAGGLELATHMDNLPCDRNRTPLAYQSGTYNNINGSSVVRGVQFALGGRSLFWSGLIPRMYDFELAFWPDEVANFFKNGGYDEAERLMRLAKVASPSQHELISRFNLRVKETGFFAADLPRSRDQAKLDAEGRVGEAIPEDVGVFSTADLLLGSLAYKGKSGSDTLTVNLHHLVIGISRNGNRWSVACVDLAGNVMRTYRSKVVVLAAGSIQSPKVAMGSGLGDRNFLGRGITDHPSFESAIYQVPSGNFLDNILRTYKVLIRHKDIASNTCPYHVEMGVNAFYWNVRFTDPQQIEDFLKRNHPSEVKFQFNFGSHLNNDNFIEFRGPNKRVNLRMIQVDQSESISAEVRRHRNRFLEALDMRELQPDRGMHYHKLGTPHHAAGSMRMGAAGRGVVNSDLEFHGHPHLYCCDTSVFPYVPIANPSLTVAALSLRLAKHIDAALSEIT